MFSEIIHRSSIYILLPTFKQNTSDSRVSDSNALKKRKEETIQSVTKSKGGITSDALQIPDVELSLTNRGSTRPVAQEEDVDKTRSSRASRSADRVLSSAKHSASPLSGADAQKMDAAPTRQSSTASAKDSHEPGRHPLGNSSGGVGDVSPGMVKANGAVRIDQSKPVHPEVQTTPSKPGAVSAPLAQSRKMVPSFHFPLGTTRMTKEEIAFEIDRAKRELARVVESLSNGNKNGPSDASIPYTSFGQVSKVIVNLVQIALLLADGELEIVSCQLLHQPSERCVVLP